MSVSASERSCFVIQPFDGGPYDKRYDDVFAPAIDEAGLKPYRVDRDPKAEVLIEAIEAGIKNSAACLADITSDNPNVWFEVGLAIAAGKPIVLVCAESRPTPFPFDVQHRHVLRYATDAPRDFDELRSDIAARLKAQLERREQLQSIAEISHVHETEGMTPHELAMLVCLGETDQGPQARLSAWEVHRAMGEAGFNKLATN